MAFCLCSLCLLVFIIHLDRSFSRSAINPLPVISSDYFSGYVEEVVSPLEQGPASASLKWIAYDAELQLFREDSFDAGSSKPSSVIEDRNIGVLYSINRQSRDCVIQPLHEDSSNLSAGLNFHMKLLQESLPLFPLSYSYEGTRVMRSLLVDTWSAHNSLTNSDVLLGLTRHGTSVSSLNSVTEESVLWQLRISRNQSLIYSVFNYFDVSFEKPNSNIFDTSICFSSNDSELLLMTLPGRLSQVDVDHLQNSIRITISNYTNVYPWQVGNIKVLADNGTFITALVQVFNLTSIANRDNKVSAYGAMKAILSNSSSMKMPFPVELSPSTPVFPTVYDWGMLDRAKSLLLRATSRTRSISSAASYHPNQMTTSKLASSWSTSEGHNERTTSQTSNIRNSIYSISVSPHPTATLTNSIHSTSQCTTVEITTITSICSFSSSCAAVTQTVTRTITETLLPYVTVTSNTAATLAPTIQPHVTEFPTTIIENGCAHRLTTGGSAGLAVGAFIGGIAASFLTIVCCMVCCNLCNQQKIKSAGYSPLSRPSAVVTKEMDHFE